MPGKGTSRKFPHGKSIKNPAQYEALKKQGMDKSTAAAISNSNLKKTGKQSVHRSKKGK